MRDKSVITLNKLTASLLATCLWLGVSMPLGQAKDYIDVRQAPPKDIAPDWFQAQQDKGESLRFAKAFPDATWWRKFQDPVLNATIEEALTDNKDFKQAAIRVRSARDMVGQSLAKEMPTVSANPAFYRLNTGNIFGSGPSLVPNTMNVFVAPLQAQYELDLFGKNLDQVKASKRDVAIAEQNRRTVQIELVSEVASAYFNLTGTDRLIALQQQALQAETEIRDLKRSRYESGFAQYDEIIQAERALANTTESIATLRNMQTAYANQVLMLEGKAPGDQAGVKRSELDKIHPDNVLESGFPAELLTHRPDIIVAEEQLRKANIEVRAAQKAFFPTLNLSAAAGFTSLHLSDIFLWQQHLALLAASFAQPIFSGGALTAKLRVQKDSADEQLQQYQKVILQALNDVENSLSSLKTDEEKVVQDKQQIQLTEDQLQLSESRVEAGFSAELESVQIRDELVGFQSSQIRNQTASLIDRLSLYKALGGGY
jgi:NodT family efflux transporter outer membrane factor (OMF) lipoprotein